VTDIQLNFINQSTDTNNSQVVIFQKNVSTSFNQLAIAWKVLPISSLGSSNPVTVPMTTLAAGASDSWGNYSLMQPAQHGQMFAAVHTATGIDLRPAATPAGTSEITVTNGMAQGSINASIYRDNRLLAIQTGIPPQQKAVFAFHPTIWVGLAPGIVEGQVMDSAVQSTINTELSLLGIASADIVMTGGGPGPAAAPFKFSLQNVVNT
jgi:hypothetical protein